jgi:hypothetical protein
MRRASPSNRLVRTNPRSTGVANALLGAYLNRVGLPYSAVVYITQSVPQSITWLSIADAKRLGIEVSHWNPQWPVVRHNLIGLPPNSRILAVVIHQGLAMLLAYRVGFDLRRSELLVVVAGVALVVLAVLAF